MTVDSTGDYAEEVRVRVLSDAAVQQFAEVGSVYDSSTGTARFEHVEVRKPSGRVIRVESDAFTDISLQVLPNVVTGLRQIRAAIPGLAPNDLIAYRTVGRVTHAQIPGQFWFSHRFATSAAVSDEALTIDVPADRVVQVKTAPGFEPTTPGGEASDGRRVYRWRRSNTAPPDTDTLAAKALERRLDPLWRGAGRAWVR